MAENKLIVGYQGLSRVVGLPVHDLMLMVADGRIRLTIHRIRGEAGFDPDEVARWLGNGCPGAEWSGKPLSLQLANLVTQLEEILAKLFHVVHVQRAHCRILSETTPTEAEYINRIVDQSMRLLAVICVSAIVGDATPRGDRVRILKALRDADYTKLTELIGKGWLDAIGLTQGAVGWTDLWDPMTGWSLMAEIERREEGAQAGV